MCLQVLWLPCAYPGKETIQDLLLMWSPHQRIIWPILPAQGPQMYEDIYSAGRHTLWTSFHIKGHKTEEQIMFIQSSHKFWQHNVRNNSYFGLVHQKTFVRRSFFAHQYRWQEDYFDVVFFFELDVYPLWELADGARCTRFCRFSQPESKLSPSTQPTPALPYCLAIKHGCALSPKGSSSNISDMHV